MLPDVVRLRHMLETALLTLQIIEGVDRASFDIQIALQWTTIRGNICAVHRQEEIMLADRHDWAW
jgi:hypothetical protein